MLVAIIITFFFLFSLSIYIYIYTGCTILLVLRIFLLFKRTALTSPSSKITSADDQTGPIWHPVYIYVYIYIYV